MQPTVWRPFTSLVAFGGGAWETDTRHPGVTCLYQASIHATGRLSWVKYQTWHSSWHFLPQLLWNKFQLPTQKFITSKIPQSNHNAINTPLNFYKCLILNIQSPIQWLILLGVMWSALQMWKLWRVESFHLLRPWSHGQRIAGVISS